MSATEAYRPSNGTAGEMFRQDWCERCHHEQGGRQCKILRRALTEAQLDVQPMTIPPELRSCAPPATPGPLPLGRGVTTEQLWAHDAAERSARQAAEAALIACADRLIQLNDWSAGGDDTCFGGGAVAGSGGPEDAPALGTAVGL